MNSRIIAPVLCAAITLGACAGQDPGTPTTLPPTSTSTSETDLPGADLTIVIGTPARPGEFTAHLVCGAEPAAQGFLVGRAQAACGHLESDRRAGALLIADVEPDRVCTEIYGGGEVADVTGTFAGRPVAITVHRANGCGIADWDLLRPILVEPYDLAGREALCSGAGHVGGDDSRQGELPAPVAALRSQLIALAGACDLVGLGALAEADGTNVSFGGADDPAEFWRHLEANGRTPMADLLDILHTAPGILEGGDGLTFHVWPAVAALDDWSQATEEQRGELAELFGTGALAEWDAFGGYIGYRVGITTQGTWSFFVAGD